MKKMEDDKIVLMNPPPLSEETLYFLKVLKWAQDEMDRVCSIPIHGTLDPDAYSEKRKEDEDS